MFDIAMAATNGGPGRATSVINMYIYEEAFRGLRFAESSAASMLILILTMLLTAVFLRSARYFEERH